MNKSIIRCPSCWEAVAREADDCPRCHTRLSRREGNGRRVFNFAFWRNCILLVLSLVMFISAFLPMFRVEIGSDVVKDVFENATQGEEVTITVKSDLPLQFEFSAADMLVYAAESVKHLPDEELMSTKYGRRFVSLLLDLVASVDEKQMTNKRVILTDKHINIINDIVDVGVHMTFLSGEEELGLHFTLAVIATLLYMMVSFALVVLALVNLILNLCKRAAPYTYVVRLVALTLPVVMAYAAIMFVTSGYSSVMWGLWVAVGTAAVMTISVAVLGLIARREHSWMGILTRTGTLVLSAAMIAVAFMPMISLAVRVQFSNAEKAVEAHVGLSNDFYTVLDVDYTYYETVRGEYVEAFNSLSEYKKSEFEEGDKVILQIETIATMVALCADQSEYTRYFAYTNIPIILMCVFAALVMWQSLCYLTLGHDMRRVPWFFRSVAAGMMLVVLVLNIVIVLVSNAGADGSVFADSAKTLGDFARFRLGISSICGTIFAIAMMCIPHGNYKKWVWGAYVLVAPAAVAETPGVAITDAAPETAPVEAPVIEESTAEEVATAEDTPEPMTAEVPVAEAADPGTSV